MRCTGPLAILALAISACRAPASVAPPPSPVAHYFDSAGQPLPAYEVGWPALADVFGDALPPRVTIERAATGNSRFDPERNVILVARTSVGAEPEAAIVAHETAHLALASLTHGASTQTELRFLDEGLAMIVQKTVDVRIAASPAPYERYRSRALSLSAGRLTTGTVRLQDLADWPHYFGVPPTFDWNAYEVGSSFVFFLVDREGAAKVHALLRDLGRTRSLAESLRDVLGTTLEETEARWEAYLGALSVHVPDVLEKLPEDGTSVGPEGLHARVRFDVDMGPSTCYGVRSPGGSSHARVRWLDARTLLIDIDTPVAAKGTWSLSAGAPPLCRLRSTLGVEAPIVRWALPPTL